MPTPRLPKDLPRRHADQWRRPWTRKAKYGPLFRRWLAAHGYLSPHFKLSEAKCADGTAVPKGMRYRARNHAFNLERLRHELGDKPIRALSWYRTPAHNVRVHGAKDSRHMKADATDYSKETVDALGREHFKRVAEKVFAHGGIGTYPGGAIHLDSRGTKARWTAF